MARGGVNKVILIGNLGQDPEVRYMPNGTAVANVRLATSESWRDKDSGEQRELTEWHRVVFYGRLAEISGEYLRKGAKVYVEGRLRTRKWQDQNGQERYTTEIQGDTLQMLDSRSGATRNTTDSRSKADSHPHEQLLTPHSAAHPNQKPSQKPSAEASVGGHDAFVDFDDSIPF